MVWEGYDGSDREIFYAFYEDATDPTNQAPILGSIGPKSVKENELLGFNITASDPDGDGLSYTASNLPTGATFDPASQEFSWMPGVGDEGNYTVQFTVTDNGSPPLSDSENFTITVDAIVTPDNTPGGGSTGDGGGSGGGCFIAQIF